MSYILNNNTLTHIIRTVQSCTQYAFDESLCHCMSRPPEFHWQNTQHETAIFLHAQPSEKINLTRVKAGTYEKVHFNMEIKWWRLKYRDQNRKFASKVEEKIKDIKEWNQLQALLLDTAKSVLGQTTGKGAYNEKESWWWNEEVQKAVKEKRLKFKQYQQSRYDEDK